MRLKIQISLPQELAHGKLKHWKPLMLFTTLSGVGRSEPLSFSTYSRSLFVGHPIRFKTVCKYFDFKRAAVLCLGHRLSTHKTTRYARNLRDHGRLGPLG